MDNQPANTDALAAAIDTSSQQEAPQQQYEQPQEQPQQMAEPMQAQPMQQPQVQEAAQPEPQQPQYQSYDDYMSGLLGEQQEVNIPKVTDIQNPEDPENINNFFNDAFEKIGQKVMQQMQNQMTLRNSEQRLWNEAMDEYPSLKDPQIRNIVHSVRMQSIRSGKMMTPSQAAESIIRIAGSQYKQGIADSQVQTTYSQVQPISNGASQPVAQQPTAASDAEAIEKGGADALAMILQRQMDAGKF